MICVGHAVHDAFEGRNIGKHCHAQHDRPDTVKLNFQQVAGLRLLH